MADTGWCFVIFISFVVFLAEVPTAVWTKSYQCPVNCTCLGPLVDCSRKDLTVVPSDLPTWVEILDLSSNRITDISPLASQGLTKLEELDLSNNKIEKLGRTLGTDLPALKELKVNYNHLKEIPLLPSGANITSLSLQHNEITSIDPDALDYLPKLRQLSMGYNDLKELRKDMFPLHPALHQLYLNNNRIKHVEKGALHNLPSLTWVKLNKNKIKHLPKEVFSDLKKLQDLELSRNKLQRIDGLTFKGMENLVTLKLDRNSITDLMDGAFYGPGNIQNLILDHNNITAITKGWLYGLTRLEVLELSHNKIAQIEEEVWTYCELLSKLDLRDNQLSVVTENAFANLGSLQHLFLDNNHMSYIAKGAFQDLRSLQVLELNHNEISWTIEDTDGAFEGLINLKRLGLRDNQIKLIGKWAFKGLDHLMALHLENNSLTSIQANAFSSVKSLQELQLNSSSLVCDCQLGWLPSWLEQAGFQHTVMAKCIHPVEVQGVSVMEVDQDQFFKCTDSPKPMIVTQPEPQAALKGSNTSLECVAVSSDPSPLVVQWRKDNILLQPATVETYERHTEEGTLEIRSVLLFQDVQDHHTGVYQCMVSNNLGTAYSAKAIITVNVLPYFLNTPADVTAPIGTTARLECKATGHPTPRIKWKKDGGDSFPAARERRLLMMPTDDVFFITKVNPEDEGVYSCTAENKVGTVVANATLKVLRRPMFEHAMEDKVVQKGSTAVLECMASGNPKPNVEWLKDDKPLQMTKRHFFTAEKRLLVIVQTTEQDDGVYTCHVQNSLAKESDQSRLTIMSTVIDKSVQKPDRDEDNDGSQSGGGIFRDDSMMTGIIIIAVVCCVVGTSLIWVIIIYKTRKRTEEYSSTPTDETTLPGEMPSTPFHSSERDSSSPGLLGVAQTPGVFGRYAGMEVNGGFGYSPAKSVRMAAIFPSDIEDDHLRQSIPLTSDEQQPAESSDTSITMLRRLRHSTGGSDTLQSTPSPQHSAPCLHGSRTNVLHTFQPHLAAPTCAHHQSVPPGCEARTTMAVVHSAGTGGHCGSCPRLDTIMSEDEPEMRSSSDDREEIHSRVSDGHHGSLPPGHYSEESDYCSSVEPYSATFPPSHPQHTEPQPSIHLVPNGLSAASLATNDSSTSLPRSSHSQSDSGRHSRTDRPTELAKNMGGQLTRPSCQPVVSYAPSSSSSSSTSPSSFMHPHHSKLANGHAGGLSRTDVIADNPHAPNYASSGDQCTDSECCFSDTDAEGGSNPLSSVVPANVIPHCSVNS